MKYLIIHGEGFVRGAGGSGTEPSWLEAAATPHMDRLARTGEFGWVAVPVEGTAPVGELTGLSILGYDPKKFSTGPAPLEAVGLGISVGEHDVVYRAQLVTLRSEHAPANRQANADAKKLTPLAVLEDAVAGNIDSESARELIDALNEGLGSETIQFYPGAGPRHYMVWVNGKSRAASRDPQAVEGHAVGEYLPTGDGEEVLRKLMDASVVVLRDHPVNLDRREAKQPTATCAWLWGQGRAAQWPPLTDKLGVSGAMVSGSPLHKGLGISAGFESVDIEDDAQGIDALRALGRHALDELSRRDFVYVHVNAAALQGAEPGAEGPPPTAVIDAFDRDVVGPLVQALAKSGPSRLLLVCDPCEQPGQPRGATYQALVSMVEGGATAERTPGIGFSERHATGAGGAARDALKLLVRLVRK